jgi:hypothetical protein
MQSYATDSIRRWAAYVFIVTCLIAIKTGSTDAVIIAFIIMIAIVILSIMFILFEGGREKDDETVEYYNTYTGPY